MKSGWPSVAGREAFLANGCRSVSDFEGASFRMIRFPVGRFLDGAEVSLSRPPYMMPSTRTPFLSLKTGVDVLQIAEANGVAGVAVS